MVILSLSWLSSRERLDKLPFFQLYATIGRFLATWKWSSKDILMCLWNVFVVQGRLQRWMRFKIELLWFLLSLVKALWSSFPNRESGLLHTTELRCITVHCLFCFSLLLGQTGDSAKCWLQATRRDGQFLIRSPSWLKPVGLLTKSRMKNSDMEMEAPEVRDVEREIISKQRII